jgi:signal transduction histidine kinase
VRSLSKGENVNRSAKLTYFGIVPALAAVYFAAGKLGLMLASVNPSATLVWPPAGIALAALLLLGRRVWPGVFLGAFLVNATTAGSLATSITIAAGNTLEGVAGAILVNRFAGGRRVFDSPRDVFKFVLLAGMLSTTVSATIGVTSLALGGFASWAAFGSIWMTWWLGDAVGDLVVAPVLVLWSAAPRTRWTRAEVIEAGLLLVSLSFVTQAVFGGLLPSGIGAYRLSFLCIPFLVWAGFRFGPRETATTSLILSGLALSGTLRGQGPFLRDTQGDPLLVLQAFMGITAAMSLSLAAVVAERKRAQEALRLKATELARSNAELEQFAYVASHDLQEPLRMVTGFVQLLKKRYHGRLDAEADEFIQFAVDGTTRMRSLIDDLLSFSRAGRAHRPLRPTDCALVLKEALGNLDPAIRESGAVLTCEEMPTVMGDATQLTQLFQNLVGNAIKFRGERRPEVHVSATRGLREWTFSVRDNGIGIQPEFANRLFVIFQRLHGRDKYAGTGIGLATCKKIVTRHGGRIWLVSEPGQGATFYFTLPLSQEGDPGEAEERDGERPPGPLRLVG